ncbi:MAG: TfoX/Sxy family protein [Sandaracinaceae bacterium]
MAFDEGLAQRIRDRFGHEVAYDEKRMFGGLAFMVRGHMTVGIVGDELMVRVGKDAYPEAVALPHARPMTFTGKPMTTMVYVAAEGIEDDRALEEWLARALAHNATQPAKLPGAPRRSSRAKAAAATPSARTSGSAAATRAKKAKKTAARGKPAAAPRSKGAKKAAKKKPSRRTRER